MTTPKSEWETKELAKKFLKETRPAIPGADLQFTVIAKIVQLWCKTPHRILDLGCGDGILGCFLSQIFPSADGTFVDFSDEMLHAAQKKTENNSHARVVKADFSTPQWLEVVTSFQPFDIIVSGFAIHHLTHVRKKTLYSEIYDLLLPDGIFLNLEHVASSTQAGEQLFDEFFIDHLHYFHSKTDHDSNRNEVSKTYYNRPDKKENILASAEEQCCWLREIGFTDVDCFFKVFELALFGGKKNSNKAL